VKDEVLKVLIVGAGQIGALGDSPGSAHILTHAHAVAEYKKNFSLLGFIDSNSQSLEKAQANWGGEGFQSFEHFISSKQKTDVVVISSPDNLHLEHILKARALNPKIIVVEKPISQSTVSLKNAMTEKLENFPLLVNYTRRYQPGHKNFLKRLSAGEFGKFLNGSGYYSKGLFHSGSHLINAILPIFSRGISNIEVTEKKIDFSEEDPSISCFMKFEDGSCFNVQSFDARVYEIFEIDLFFEKGRVRIDNLGNRISYFFPQPLSTGTSIQYIREPQEIIESNNHESFLNLYNEVSNVLSGQNKITCDIQDSLQTLEICEKIRRMADGK
jgi:predicted dehydrogenase